MEMAIRHEPQPLKLLITWLYRIHSREKLKHLSDHALKDIGLTRQQVQAEIAKPFWRA